MTQIGFRATEPGERPFVELEFTDGVVLKVSIELTNEEALIDLLNQVAEIPVETSAQLEARLLFAGASAMLDELGYNRQGSE